MDFEFTAEQEDFRQEVRDFLEDEIKKGTFRPMCDGWIQGFSWDFTKKVAGKGWLGITWPKQYGGLGRSHIDRLILTEEMLRYDAAHTTVPPGIAQRLQKSTGDLPGPKTSWWKRLFGGTNP